MTFKKRMFNKQPRRIQRDAGARNKTSTFTCFRREYVNKHDREQQEWARTFNHWSKDND